MKDHKLGICNFFSSLQTAGKQVCYSTQRHETIGSCSLIKYGSSFTSKSAQGDLT